MQLNNKRRELIIPTTDITRAWLSLTRGLTKLTDREIDVLVAIIKKRSSLKKEGIKQPYLSQLLFSSDVRKEYCDELGISEFNLTNLLSSLRKKKALHKVNEVEDVFIKLLPSKEVTIRFIPSYDRRKSDSKESS